MKLPPPQRLNAGLVMRLGRPLDRYVQANELGEVYLSELGFLLARNPDTVREPDAAFISRERLAAAGEVEGYWPGAPDVVVEVVSPGDTYTGVEDKVVDWLDAGARMVVAANPRTRIMTVYRSRRDSTILTENDSLDGGDVVPGWSISVADVFG